MVMFQRLSSVLEKSFDIPEPERAKAEESSELFTGVINAIQLAENNIEIIENAFTDTEVSPELLNDSRGLLHRYKQQIRENYSKIKIISFRSIRIFNDFTSDHHIVELINSFKDKINETEKAVTDLLEAIDNHNSEEFTKELQEKIDAVKKENQELEELIKDRIISYIDDNILGKNWVSDIGAELNMEIEDKVPIITELYNERKKVVNDPSAAAGLKPTQLMNPADQDRMTYPTTTGDKNYFDV